MPPRRGWLLTQSLTAAFRGSLRAVMGRRWLLPQDPEQEAMAALTAALQTLPNVTARPTAVKRWLLTELPPAPCSAPSVRSPS